jgi:hypothetical protein
MASGEWIVEMLGSDRAGFSGIQQMLSDLHQCPPLICDILYGCRTAQHIWHRWRNILYHVPTEGPRRRVQRYPKPASRDTGVSGDAHAKFQPIGERLGASMVDPS